MTARATPGVRVGVSASRAAWLDDRLAGDLPAGRTIGDYRQQAWGADVEVSDGARLARCRGAARSLGPPHCRRRRRHLR
ncbi:MAG: hypothetical protein R2712_01690 [Vicinamibacterales bacterium]